MVSEKGFAMSDTTPDAAPLAGRREWLGLAALAAREMIVKYRLDKKYVFA